MSKQITIKMFDESDFSSETVFEKLKEVYMELNKEYGSYGNHLFGFLYADVLDYYKIDIKEFLKKVNISENYYFEINKGKSLSKNIRTKNIVLNNTIKSSKRNTFPLNRIIFGAPGTGKSHQLEDDLTDESGASYFSYYERVTFHPSYSYANFVGTYKPVKDEREKGQITYEFVEGPFIRVLRQALCDTNGNNYLLIIEEINRANVTAVFGDVFQLLDRDSNNISQYEVASSEDLRKHLLKHGVSEDKASVLKIPSNMYIWATMNSADQGVQPLDTAFKRRWEFEYLNINNSENKIDDNMNAIQFPNEVMDWNMLRHLINNRLSSSYNINEDKLLGPFFIRKNNQNDEQFLKSFKSKVLMYLFEDVCKINPKPLFAGIDKQKIFFSDIVESFNEKGLGIFKFSTEEIKTVENELAASKEENSAK